jgi:hypothetical protein
VNKKKPATLATSAGQKESGMSILPSSDFRNKAVNRDDFDRWRWQARLSTGHEPTPFSTEDRHELRDWLIDLLATCRSDPIFAGELRELVSAVLSTGRESA